LVLPLFPVLCRCQLEEHSDVLFRRLGAGAHIYFCGTRAMMPPIQVTASVHNLPNPNDL
jgi:hypothetical protein